MQAIRRVHAILRSLQRGERRGMLPCLTPMLRCALGFACVTFGSESIAVNALAAAGNERRPSKGAAAGAPLAVLKVAAYTNEADGTISASVDYAPPGYALTFSDEFTGNSLNRSKWCTRYVYGGGPALQLPDPACTTSGHGTLDFFNDEKQRYVDYNADGKAMHEVRDGVVMLHATKTRQDGDAPYESAMVRSKALFRADATTSYYITARVRMPDVIGSWPAFWLAPDLKPDGSVAWPPEIDILEGALNGVEDNNRMLHMGAQQQNFGGTGKRGKPRLTYRSSHFEPQYRNYIGQTNIRKVWLEVAVEWTATGICSFLNGVKQSCEDYEWKQNSGQVAPASPILLNLAIGGNWAGRHGIDDGSLPTSFDIDYVRVYRKSRSP